ncbi:MAG: hypothetical protein AAF985_25755, partial [Bacteroidota bacterium]
MKKILFALLLSWSPLAMLSAQSPDASLALNDAPITNETQEANEAAETVNFEQILWKADFYRGGHIPGIAWDLEVQNIEKGKIKNEISLINEANVFETRLFALLKFLIHRKY